MTVPEPSAALRAQYLDVVTRALATISAADPGLRIGLGPGATVADVVSWTAAFATTAADQLSSIALTPRPPVPHPDGLTTASPALLEALVTTPSRRPCWTPSPAVPPQAEFWLRRSAHALSVRAWQVQVAQDEPVSLEPWLLLDGVDEHLTVMFAVACCDPQTPAGRAAGTIAVRCTDVDAHWRLRLEPGCVPLLIGGEPDAPADAVLAGDTATLRLGLAGMLPLPEGSGEAALLAALRLR